MHLNGLRLSGALGELFLSLHDFWVQKCKSQLYEDNKRFGCSFYQVEEQMITNPSCRLKKPTLESLPLTDLL